MERVGSTVSLISGAVVPWPVSASSPDPNINIMQISMVVFIGSSIGRFYFFWLFHTFFTAKVGCFILSRI